MKANDFFFSETRGVQYLYTVSKGVIRHNKSNSYGSTFVPSYGALSRLVRVRLRRPLRVRLGGVDHRGGVHLGEERQAVVHAAGAAR